MTHPIGYRSLRDHQPDILFQGDVHARARHSALATAEFLEYNIRLERLSIAQTTDPDRIAAAWKWIRGAVGARRNALRRAGCSHIPRLERNRPSG